MLDKVRVLVADDNEVMRLVVSLLIGEVEDFELVGEAADGQTAVEMVRGLMPYVVIMDVSMPKMSGIEATEKIHSEFPQLNIIGFSMLDRGDVGQAMLNAGAVNCLSKDLPWDTVLSSIRQSITARSIH